MTISPDDEGRASRSPFRLKAPAPDVHVAAGSQPPSTLRQASIVTPGDWVELDLDPATRHTSIRRAVRRAIVRSPALAPDAVPLIALLDRMTGSAADAGAFYCASRVIEDTADGVLVATVVMQLSDPGTGPLMGGAPNLSVAQWCGALVAVIENDPEWVGVDVGVVTLPFVGPAVRLRVEDGAIIVQYMAPLVGRHTTLLVTFTCSSPPHARVMTELFDTMAQSVSLHYG
jgi:hypothetical protein